MLKELGAYSFWLIQWESICESMRMMTFTYVRFLAIKALQRPAPSVWSGDSSTVTSKNAWSSIVNAQISRLSSLQTWQLSSLSCRYCSCTLSQLSLAVSGNLWGLFHQVASFFLSNSGIFSSSRGTLPLNALYSRHAARATKLLGFEEEPIQLLLSKDWRAVNSLDLD